jgi:two-component system sensor kinase FixL
MIAVDHTAVPETPAPDCGVGVRKRLRGRLPASPLSPPLGAGHDEHLLTVLATLPIALMAIDTQGAVTYANEACATLFGYDDASLTGVRVDTLLPALAMDPTPLTPADTGTRRSTLAARPAHEMLGRRADGSEIPLAVTAHGPYSNAPAATLITIVDRRDHYELDHNRKALAHLARVSTLGQIAGSLAHELNQPLTAILANAQAARRLMDAPPVCLEEIREILDDLVKDNQRASEVLRKIRLLVRQGDPEIQPLALAALLDDVLSMVHSDAIVRGMRMSLDVPPDLPRVAGDRIQLQQVVLNLLLNAFEAMMARPRADRVVTIQARLDKQDMIRIAVRDRGCGFPAEALATLFTPYVSSKREGLGLGLCISRSIVEVHGGRLWAEQNPDMGATIYFTVPSVPATRPRT